jgi:hypothetical protein
MCYRHQHLPQQDRWITPLLDHMETNIWKNTSGDLWNDRWTEELLSSLLQDSGACVLAQREYKKTLSWLQTLTDLLQSTQRALYAMRRIELLSSLEAKTRRDTVVALRQRRTPRRRSQTLHAACWKIPYNAPTLPRRRQPLPILPRPPQISLSHRLSVAEGRWIQYSKARMVSAPKALSPSPALHRRITKTSKREDNRTRKLKLRKLRNVLLNLLLCR